MNNNIKKSTETADQSITSVPMQMSLFGNALNLPNYRFHKDETTQIVSETSVSTSVSRQRLASSKSKTFKIFQSINGKIFSELKKDQVGTGFSKKSNSVVAPMPNEITSDELNVADWSNRQLITRRRSDSTQYLKCSPFGELRNLDNLDALWAFSDRLRHPIEFHGIKTFCQ